MEVKRKRVVSLACTFCKKRHIKCDGNSPCSQCISRNEECVFETNRKRGRKIQKDLQIISIPTEINISPTDEVFHPTFLYNFLDKFASLYPHYVPKAFSCSTSIKIGDTISWKSIKQLTPTNCLNKSLSDLTQMAEYAVSCALGTKVTHPYSDLGNIFIEKANTILQVIGTNLDQDPSLVIAPSDSSFTIQASDLVLLHDLTGFYLLNHYWLGVDKDLLNQRTRHVLQGYAIYNLYKNYIRGDSANRMFMLLAGTASEIEDSYHFLKKFKLTENVYNNCINLLVGVFSVCSAFYLKQHMNTTNVKTKRKIYSKLLQYMRECEKSFVESPLPTDMPWIAIMWDIDIALLMYQLNMPYEGDLLNLLDRLLEITPQFCQKRPTLHNSLGFLLMMIPKEKISQEMWNKSMALFAEREAQFPGFMDLMQKIIFAGENRVEEIEENSVEMKQFVLSDEEIQSLMIVTLNNEPLVV